MIRRRGNAAAAPSARCDAAADEQTDKEADKLRARLAKLKAELFPNGPALGQFVRVGDRRFRVIGVLAALLAVEDRMMKPGIHTSDVRTLTRDTIAGFGLRDSDAKAFAPEKDTLARQKTVVLTRSTAPWLAPGECLVVSDVTFVPSK